MWWKPTLRRLTLSRDGHHTVAAYKRSKIQDESMVYEHRKHDGTLPIIGVNTYLPKEGQEAGGELEQHPGTPPDKRLLRPAMIEALIEYEPVSLSEFQEVIPEYVRKGTDRNEARAYLAAVLEIVAGSEESEVVDDLEAQG